MKNKQIGTINTIFNKQLVKEAIPSVEEIIAKMLKKKSVKLIYGETYDRFGITIDSLKYYFYLSLLHRELETLGVNVSSYVMIGDLHSIKNRIVTDKKELFAQAEERLLVLNKIKTKYNLKFNTILMSDAFEQVNFKDKIDAVKRIFDNTPECKQIAQKTVLKNRLAQEEKVGYQYTIEEVALIMDYDIKVGPPREVYFDQLARLVATKLNKDILCGIYLKPTYPLGLGFDYFLQHPEIEEYGLTPYKAGSNKLQDNRIVLGNTIRNQFDRLLETTFIPKNLELPNPLLDLLTITDLAKSCLNNKVILSNYQELVKETDKFKNILQEQLKLYIYEPLGY